MSREAEDLSGCRFGRWRVISRAANPKCVLWWCACKCGTKRQVHASALKGKRTRSCGCLQREQLSLKMTTHGKSRSTEHQIYRGMLNRCYRLKNKDYKYYGGRGIKVCRRWRESFENFYADMGPRPDNKSLDRKDNNGDYCPQNCRWGTWEEQVGNRRSALKDCVPLIRRLRLQGATMQSLAFRFGTGSATIFSIVHRQTHRGVL